MSRTTPPQRLPAAIALLAFLVFFPGSLFAAPPSAVMPKKYAAFFKSYCLDCHSSEAKEGEVDLENLSFDLGTIQSAERWQKVLGALNSGEMPPEDETQPKRFEKTRFLEDLSQRLVVARQILSDSGGIITMRRQNNREYQNTMRDLLGVEVDISDLPDDSSSGSFDTVGASQFFSSDQFEQYLKIARRALNEAIAFGPKPPVKRVRHEGEVATKRIRKVHAKLLDGHLRGEQWKKSDKPPKAFGFIDADRVKFEERIYRQQWATNDRYLKDPASQTGALLQTWFGGAQVDVTKIPFSSRPGNYLLRVRVGALPGAAEHQRFLEFGRQTDGARTGELDVLGCRRVSGTLQEPEILELPIQVTADGRAFGIRQRQANSRDAARFDYLQTQQKTGVGPAPALWVDWVEWEGPFIEHWPPPAHKTIFFRGLKTKHSDEYAREILTRFAKRAFRIKEPAPAFVDKLMQLYSTGRQRGDGFVKALKEPLAVILASPSFLYLVEPVADPQRRELTDLELAIRLSYFLWSSPPDDELYGLARQGQLKKPDVLAEQTNRLLRDPKAAEFVSGFTHQWLTMDRLDFFQFNYRFYSEFDESVKDAARREVYETLKTVLSENLPVGRLLKADFVVINDLLADYYGIQGVEGDHFRKVDVPADSPRGGLLGMAAVLAMGSDGERSSPVERGAWVMRKLLHSPPPPAPANVPQLSRLAGKLLPARKLQAAHMHEPQCAQCHRKIDPLGFGMENFNAAGRWREKELTQTIVKRRVKRSKLHDIDPSGTMPDGKPFANFFELRDRVADHEADFARGLTEGLIEYGLGRPYGFSDHELAEQMIKKAESKELRLRAFIHALIQSKQFRTK